MVSTKTEVTKVQTNGTAALGAFLLKLIMFLGLNTSSSLKAYRDMLAIEKIMIM